MMVLEFSEDFDGFGSAAGLRRELSGDLNRRA